jgi:phosphoglucosamine mutase
VLVVRDTRESGEMLEAAMAAGLASAGAEVLLGGVLPTPAASLLIRRHGFDLGVVLSASHNIYADNGIKFFGADGFKLSDETEQRIEEHLDEAPSPGGAPAIGRIRQLHGATEDYMFARAARALPVAFAQRRRRAARLRQRRHLSRRRRRSSSGSARASRRSPSSPTGATSTIAAARRTSRRSPRR